MAEKIKLNFHPDAKNIPLQFGLDEKRVKEMARISIFRFMESLSDNDGKIDYGIAINEAVQECETPEELVFITYSLMKFMEGIDSNPLVTLMTTLVSQKRKLEKETK